MALRRRVHPNRTGCLGWADCADDAGCGKDEGAEGCGDCAAEAGWVVAVHFKFPFERLVQFFATVVGSMS